MLMLNWIWTVNDKEYKMFSWKLKLEWKPMSRDFPICIIIKRQNNTQYDTIYKLCGWISEQNCPPVKRGIVCKFSPTLSRDELANSTCSTNAVLLKLHFRNDNVILKNGPTAHADSIATSLIDVNIATATIWANLRHGGNIICPSSLTKLRIQGEKTNRYTGNHTTSHLYIHCCNKTRARRYGNYFTQAVT